MRFSVVLIMRELPEIKEILYFIGGIVDFIEIKS